jgi:hypothetical protein
LCLAFLSVALVAICILTVLRRPALRAAFDAIQKGMTRTEVEAILGRAPGWQSKKYAPSDFFVPHYRNRSETYPACDPRCYSATGVKDDYGRLNYGWGGEKGAIVIVFDEDSRVLTKRLVPHPNWYEHWRERRERPGFWNWVRNKAEDLFGRDAFDDD